MFSDANCMYLAGEMNAYSLYQTAVAQSYNEDADGDGQQDNSWSADDLAYGYMQLVTEMFQDEYSCAMGAVRSYNGAVSLHDMLLFFYHDHCAATNLPYLSFY